MKLAWPPSASISHLASQSSVASWYEIKNSTNPILHLVSALKYSGIPICLIWLSSWYRLLHVLSVWNPIAFGSLPNRFILVTKDLFTHYFNRHFLNIHYIHVYSTYTYVFIKILHARNATDSMVGKKETAFTLRAYKPMRKNNVNQMIIQMKNYNLDKI